MYLTYPEYVALGGKADEADFPRMAYLAEKKLNHWTQGRIKDPDHDIKVCMALIIDAISEDQGGERDVSSFSHDGVSVTLAGAKTPDQMMDDVYQKVVEILPVELVSLCV